MKFYFFDAFLHALHDYSADVLSRLYIKRPWVQHDSEIERIYRNRKI